MRGSPSKLNLTCPTCAEALLRLAGTWYRIYFRCRGCGDKIALQDMVESIDEDLELMLGNMPCDRL